MLDLLFVAAPTVGALVVHLVMTAAPKASLVPSAPRQMPRNTRR